MHPTHRRQRNSHPNGRDPAHLRICLIGCFPPSRGDLNEYGFHLASALRNNPAVELVVLADETKIGEEVDGFQVERCWKFNSILTPARLMRAIRRVQPDVVWFNMGFSTFASGPVAAFLSVASPAMARWSGFYTHVTLHTVFERINLKDAGIRMPRAYRVAGRIATRALLHAHDLSVLLPSFRSELVKNYGADGERVHFRPHGIFSPAIPREDVQTVPTVLAFGYWGTYKRLDLLLECWPKISEQLPQAQLVVGGLNHPSAPGYLESLQKEYAEYVNIKFLGYVPEASLPILFRNASVLVLPYTSAAGTSGVVHQACEHGLPMVAASIPEIEELAREHRLAIHFYPQGDRTALTNHLMKILTSAGLRREMTRQNLAAASNMQISDVVGEYLNLFKARTQAMRPGGHSHSRRKRRHAPQRGLSQQVGEWLLHSGIEHREGGVARYYLSDEKRNKPVSTEITGYCASALVFLHQCTGEQRYFDAAVKHADFLARKAWDSKCMAMPFEHAGDNKNYSYFFDAGIIVRGLLAVWRMSRNAEFLNVATCCGESMLQDHFNGKDFDPIITLPDKKPIPHVPAKWSRGPGCYQLKAALGWQELWEATGEVRFLNGYRRVLKASLDSHLSFLPGVEDDLEVMNRLHAYSYFLEGLLPAISETDCRNAMQAGIDRLAQHARTIAPKFLRSDVIAQLLRVRIFADQAGVTCIDRETASHEASLLREFQSTDPDPRLADGFWFGRKAGTMLPFMNPVSTVFCYQTLEMWDRYQNGEREFKWQDLI